MPIFEYTCDDCGTAFEKLVRKPEDASCPSCGEHHLQQQHSTFAARTTGPAAAAAMAGGCPAGMCGNPGMCGRN
ncbi:MAG: zinc ribbon domain-containing protein [Acidobacteriota bacterium]